MRIGLVLISGFVFVWWALFSLVSVPASRFSESASLCCLLPVLLTCLAAVFTGNSCWCWRLGEGEVRGRWSVAVLGVTLRIGSRETEIVKVYSQPTWSSGRLVVAPELTVGSQG